MKAVSILVVLVAIGFGLFYVYVYRDDFPKDPVHISGSNIRFWRTTGGVVGFEGKGDIEFAKGLGFAHAKDRLLQMYLQLALGEGKLSEWFFDKDATRNIDAKFIKLGFLEKAIELEQKLPKETKDFLQAYCDGVNAQVASEPFKQTLEMLLVGYHPSPWTPVSSIVASFVFGYAGLSSIQSVIERALIDLLAAGSDPEKTKLLFAPFLDDLEPSHLENLKKLNKLAAEDVIPLDIFTSSSAFSASNNWVIHGNHTDSQGAFMASDPHLVISRVPNFFAEFYYRDLGGECGDEHSYLTGIALPGIPSMVMGRNGHVSYSATFGCMDQSDYFIERIVDGKVQTPTGFVPLTKRVRKMVPKNAENPIDVFVYSTPNGVLEVDYTKDKLEDGYYLAYAWTWLKYSDEIPTTLNALFRRPRACTSRDMAALLRPVAMSGNFVFADKEGNIAYQQTGLLPRRLASMIGLRPGLGWIEADNWKGVVPPDMLHNVYNPPEGFIVTANQLIKGNKGINAMTIYASSSRADRATNVIRDIISKRKVTMDDMKLLQMDLYSLNAEKYMSVIRPYLSAGDNDRDHHHVEVLNKWKYVIDEHNIQGSMIFTRLKNEIVDVMIGDGLFGRKAVRHMRNSTAIINLTAEFIDEIFFGTNSTRSTLFYHMTRENIIKQSIKTVFHELQHNISAPVYATSSPHFIRNMFFQGMLPEWMGFDLGPVPLRGSADTLYQGSARFENNGPMNVGPCWRYLTDMSTDFAFSSLTGGASGRRFSQYYASDIPLFIQSKYKIISYDP